MADPRLIRLLEQLRASKFAELKGARMTATIPLPERLLNEVIAAVLPRSAPVRDVTVQPRESNRLTVRAKLARAEFLPAFNLTLQIEQQPQLPDGPFVLRVLSLPGLMPLASAAVSMIASLPPGLRLEGDRLFVDVRALLERNGQGEVLSYLESVRITSDDGRLLVDVSLAA